MGVVETHDPKDRLTVSWIFRNLLAEHSCCDANWHIGGSSWLALARADTLMKSLVLYARRVPWSQVWNISLISQQANSCLPFPPVTGVLSVQLLSIVPVQSFDRSFLRCCQFSPWRSCRPLQSVRKRCSWGAPYRMLAAGFGKFRRGVEPGCHHNVVGMQERNFLARLTPE